MINEAEVAVCKNIALTDEWRKLMTQSDEPDSDVDTEINQASQNLVDCLGNKL